MKKHHGAKILRGSLDRKLHENNHDFNSYKVSYQIGDLVTFTSKICWIQQTFIKEYYCMLFLFVFSFMLKVIALTSSVQS